MGICKFTARFLAFSNKISTVQKIVLSSSRELGQGLKALRSRPRTSKCVLEAKDVLKDSTSAKGLLLNKMFTTALALLLLMKFFPNTKFFAPKLETF